jgi:DNA topoisomerase II
MSASDYTQLSLHEQILKRPDTYVGTNNTHTESRWIWDTATKRFQWRTVTVNPALLKIFDEILVNALDHRVRMLEKKSPHPLKHLTVMITPTTVTVRNDGEGIPVDEHPETKRWAPEMIFGNLLTSSNYDDTQERVVGGMNGYGAKLTNIFSTEFTVETVDASRQKRYRQTWRKNMFECGKPSITKATVKPYTEISFTPDLTRFKWSSGESAPTEIPADMLAILRTRVVDAAACAGKDVKVILDGEPVAANTFPKYVNLYLDDGEGSVCGASGATGGVVDEDGGASVATGNSAAKAKKRIAYEMAGERWEIAAALTSDLHGDTPPDERHISFVNGIATRRGGKHVEYVAKHVLAAFCEMAKKKAKLADITPALIKNSVVWFINATIVNPSFDTQTKESLMTPATDFGSLPVISPKFVDQLAKIGLLDEAQALLDAKTAKDAKKTDGKKRSVVRGIPKLVDAEWAGTTARSAECTLILTEGDSAATTAISGLKVVGRDRYGVFPLKGKILNVKDASAAKKTANQELTYIKQILGLEHGKVYTDLKQLRYGRVMIMTDQDVDGSHIKGLLMNLFHTEWPSLLQLGFLCCLMTPLLKATKGKQTLCFYSESEYEAWQGGLTPAEARGWHVKYYKGLGTSSATEAREYFANMNMVEFEWDEAADSSIDLAFNKRRADDRKDWLTTYDRARALNLGAGGGRVGYTRFVNDELIHFSIADNIRSIPSVMDGLKPSQRKILWAALKRNLTAEIKVAQLAGYVSETAAYHHGEASLMGAIIGMAQNFVGSNNLNLLSPNGQFGSRLMGGEDAASPRYIFTALEPIVRTLVKREDDAILEYMDDDGQRVEPVNYLPVVPLLLVNGALGIGTGFSTTVIPYNPRDVVAALRARLAGTKATLSCEQLTPWWFGFRGSVVGGADTKSWTTRGTYVFEDDDSATVRITELPVGTWSNDYRAFLEQMLVDQEEAKAAFAAASKKRDKGEAVTEKALKKPTTWLLGYKEACNDVDVDFVLQMDPDAYHTARAYPAEFEARFKLTGSHKTTNMVAFTAEGRIHRYESVGEILEEFYGVRLAAYGRRKAHELARMREEIRELDARLVFVRAVVDRRLVVANAEDADLLAGLKALGLPALSNKGAAVPAADDLSGYDYLLRMRVDRLKASAVAELEGEVAKAKAAEAALAAATIESLWLRDLEEFEAAWVTYETARRAAYEEAATSGVVADGGTKKKAVVRRKAPAPKK